MLIDILLKGAIRLAIGYGLSGVLSVYTNAKIGDNCPELKYGYPKKKKNYVKSILGDALYFVPIVGTVMLILNGIVVGGFIVANETIGKSKKFKDEINNKLGTSIETPDERLKKLQNGEESYKIITDSLKMDGLNDKEIREFMKEARKVEPYLSDDNSKEITTNMQRVKNLELLEPMKELLKNPRKAYNYCLDKKIQYANIDDDTITIGVSKLNKNGIPDEIIDEDKKPKMYAKKFKMQ